MPAATRLALIFVLLSATLSAQETDWEAFFTEVENKIQQEKNGALVGLLDSVLEAQGLPDTVVARAGYLRGRVAYAVSKYAEAEIYFARARNFYKADLENYSEELKDVPAVLSLESSLS